MKPLFELSEISKARAPILGAATLWVVLFHSGKLNFQASRIVIQLHLDGILQRIQSCGNSGVDIFLFLSGFGLWYAYNKNRRLGRFYSRRFLRILPGLFIVSTIFYGICLRGGKELYWQVVPVWILCEGVQGRQLVVFFPDRPAVPCLSPFHVLIERHDLKATLALCLMAIAFLFVLRKVDVSYLTKTERALTRIPIFIIGIWFGRKSVEHATIPAWLAWCSIPAFLLCFAAVSWLKPMLVGENRFIRRYTYIPLTVLFVLSMSCLHTHFKFSFPKKMLSFFGGYSMEIYLLYETLYNCLFKLFPSIDQIGITYAATLFSISIVLSVLLKNVTQAITTSILTLSLIRLLYVRPYRKWPEKAVFLGFLAFITVCIRLLLSANLAG